MIRINQSTGQRATKSQIKQALPHLSFAAESDLSEYGFPTLETVAQPDPIDADHRVIAGPDEEYAPGQWRQTWQQEPIPESPVPQSMSRLQAMIAISHASSGLIPELTDAQGNSIVPTLEADVQAWRDDPSRTMLELAYFDNPTWRRSDPLINAFGLSDTVIDELFKYGATQ